MSKSTADFILANAKVITCDRSRPQAEAVAVRGKYIILVGTNQEIKQFKGEKTRIIDCQGNTLVPGFNDAHCHIFPLLRKLFSLDLSPGAVRSIQDIQRIIRGKALFSPKGRWISGFNYNEFYLEEKRHPTRRDLDEATSNHPVILYHRSSHACVLNTYAMKLIGITGETEEPEGGVIDRDLETGEPNGIFYEMGSYIRDRIESPLSSEEIEWGISEVNKNLLSLGITSIGEASVSNDMNQWLTYRRLIDSGKITSRIYMMAGWQNIDQFKKAGLVTGKGDDKLRIGSLKIVLSEARGSLLPPQDELNNIVLEANRTGFQVAIHGVEQTTMEAATAALEFSREQFPENKIINRVEHGSECPPGIRQRLSRLKAMVVSQPAFIYYSGERYLSQVDPKVQPWLYPFKSLMEAGVLVAGSSDSPIVPCNPLVGIYAAVTRKSETGQVVTGSESLIPQQALEMFTLNGAYASSEKHIKGTLSSGKLADIVMLNADPLLSPPELIKDISVQMTIQDGEVVWEATSQKQNGLI
jgi:predicted amidohydrolase YtcJ